MTNNHFLHQQPRYVAFSLLSLNLAVLALAHTPAPSSIARRATRQPDGDQPCGFEGNNDAYGLGIRLGIYIQWLIAAASSCFLQDGGQSVVGISNCYRLAMFIGLLFITIKHGPDLQASEAAVMFLLGAGGAFTAVGAPDLQSGRASTAAVGAAVQVLIRLALGSYAVWFFSTGMDRMLHPPCSAFGFLLVKVDLYGWARILFNTVAACHVFVNTCILMSSLVLPATAPTGKSESTNYKAFAAGVVVLTVFVTGIELVIKWNHIQGVNQIDSTGQLLPLVVSLGTLISLMWRGTIAAGKKINGEEDENAYEIGEIV